MRMNALEVHLVKEAVINVKLDFGFMVKVMSAVKVKNGIESQGTRPISRQGAWWWRFGSSKT